jgi:hypothetical protein
MTPDDFRELIEARVGDIDGPDLTQGDVIAAAADACVEAMGKAKAELVAKTIAATIRLINGGEE